MAAKRKTNEPTDPPMRRSPGSTVWFETGPNPIRENGALATAIVKIGMATNAINMLLMMSRAVRRRRRSATKTRDSLALLVTSAAYLKEAIELAGREMPRLRPLAVRAGMPKHLLDQVGQLCAGKHASRDTLRYARKKIGFHWDDDVIRPSVLEYGKNKRIVWLETDASGHPVHTLAFNVLAHALLPRASAHTDPAAAQAETAQSLLHFGEALDLITHFFTASVHGYLRENNAHRKTLTGRARTGKK